MPICSNIRLLLPAFLARAMKIDSIFEFYMTTQCARKFSITRRELLFSRLLAPFLTLFVWLSFLFFELFACLSSDFYGEILRHLSFLKRSKCWMCWHSTLNINSKTIHFRLNSFCLSWIKAHHSIKSRFSDQRLNISFRWQNCVWRWTREKTGENKSLKVQWLWFPSTFIVRRGSTEEKSTILLCLFKNYLSVCNRYKSESI